MLAEKSASLPFQEKLPPLPPYFYFSLLTASVQVTQNKVFHLSTINRHIHAIKKDRRLSAAIADSISNLHTPELSIKGVHRKPFRCAVP
jgi:hypothetical protein